MTGSTWNATACAAWRVDSRVRVLDPEWRLKNWGLFSRGALPGTLAAPAEQQRTPVLDDAMSLDRAMAALKLRHRNIYRVAVLTYRAQLADATVAREFNVDDRTVRGWRQQLHLYVEGWTAREGLDRG